ncbi:MAG: hydroxymethylbilane synthase [Candidatus Accumulibacter sp.]|nr:hydroxymethylbilane synthase [Accumulibacter sp.]
MTRANTGVQPPSRLVIASRESRLALWQAEYVASRITALYPECEVEILGMTTRGDRILDKSLSLIGGKALFVKELEAAIAEGRADLAVHSLKDVPMEMPEGFSLVAVLKRENACDAFVSDKYDALEALPDGARIGTSSARREAALRAEYPFLKIEALRGNLDTRLRKLDEGRYDAIILAAAGLIRLGLEKRIRALIPPEKMLPAPGQGALGVEIRSDRRELAAWLAPLDDVETACCVRAERALARALGGSCQVPLGAHALFEKKILRLRAFVATPDGATRLFGEKTGTPADAEAIGAALARELLDRGADDILAQIASQAASA